jgi:hypothetical protein
MLEILFGAVTIGFVVWAVSRPRLPIRFKTYDELYAVQEVVRWASKHLGLPHRGDRRLLTTRALFTQTIDFLPMRSISREDLAVLAPFIDEWIEGKAPPQNLPAEYEDYRPSTLLAFKRRLVSEGVWPSESGQGPSAP